MARPKVFTLMGPTASGKTDAAIETAERRDVDLISVDSAMVYRRMDIGTAKPAPHVLERYPHALVDVVDPADSYSAARFVADADAAVRGALAAGRIPLLVGGTMLYFRAFKHGINALPSADAALRRRITLRAARVGWPTLHQDLAARDPAAAAYIDPNNRQRIQRAWEVFEITGRSITDAWAESTVPAVRRLDCELIELAIMPPDRSILHQRIGARLDSMLAKGLVDEVDALRNDPALDPDLPAMRSVGYRQVWRYLDGDYGHTEMVDRVRAATRQVAKRQLTWLRRWPELTRIADGDAAAAKIVTLAATTG